MPSGRTHISRLYKCHQNPSNKASLVSRAACLKQNSATCDSLECIKDEDTATMRDMAGGSDAFLMPETVLNSLTYGSLTVWTAQGLLKLVFLSPAPAYSGVFIAPSSSAN